MRPVVIHHIFWLLLTATFASAAREVEISAPPTDYVRFEVHADWRDVRKISLDLSLLGTPPGHKVLLAFYIQNKEGHWIESRQNLRLVDNEKMRFDLDVSELSDDWLCRNTTRSFGIDQLSWVKEWGIRVYSADPYAARLKIGELTLTRKPTQPAASLNSARSVEWADTLTVQHRVAMQWRMDDFREDPYELNGAPALIFRKDGKELRFPSAWVQRFVFRRSLSNPEGALQEFLRPTFRSWVQLPSQGDWVAYASWRGREKRLGKVRVQASIAKETPTLHAEGDRLRSYRVRDLRNPNWMYVREKEVWAQVDVSQVWAPYLDWNAQWGRLQGLGRFDQLRAWSFEEALTQAPADEAGWLLLCSESTLTPYQNYNWQNSPWRAGNPTGLIAHPQVATPAELWQQKAWMDLLERRARYLWSRYGGHDQVKGLYIDVRRSSVDSVEWIGELAKRLGDDIPIACPSAGLPARRFVEPLWGRSPLQADARLSRAPKIRRDGERLVATAPKGETQLALSAKTMTHLTGVDSLLFELVPQIDAPHATQFQVQLRTAPDRVFASPLLPLHNNETNRVFVSMGKEGHWTCLQDPTLPWTEIERLNIRETILSFYQQDVGDSSMKVEVNAVKVVGEPRHSLQPRKSLALEILQQPAARLGQFERAEWVVDFGRMFRNPYDPDEIALDVEIIGPKGQRWSHPGYFEQLVDLRENDGVERVALTAQSLWRIKITLFETGLHKWTVRARYRDSAATDHEVVLEETGSFTVDAGDKRGFVVQSKRDPRYFEFSNGDFYYPMGQNMRSPTDRRPNIYGQELLDSLDADDRLGTGVYERWFKRMNEAGGNFCRVWMSSWWVGLEWSYLYEGFHGRKYYNQKNAARLDRIMELAEKYGIYNQSRYHESRGAKLKS